jgi:GTP-binding protein
MKVLSSDWEATAAGVEGFPEEGLPEIAFLGRSNVGKSSLLNRLLKRKNLARTSSTPGKTRLLHFYRVRGAERSLLFVDLPGYGYAQVSKGERIKWKRLIETYLEVREPLVGAVLLHDVRRDVTSDEVDLLSWLDEQGVPSVLALTKTDKLKPNARVQRLKKLRSEVAIVASRVVATSATSGEGIPQLWETLDSIIAQRDAWQETEFAVGEDEGEDESA